MIFQNITLRNRFYGRLAACYTVLLMVMFFIPAPEIEALPDESNIDKLVHAGMFIIFTFIWSLALNDAEIQYWLLIVFGVGFSLFVELVQTALPWRTGDGWDILANAIGIVGGLAAVRIKAG